jgi:hypothetical protein
MDKVRGGTPYGTKSMCVNCRNAQVVRGLNNQELTVCRLNGWPLAVRFPVESCSGFDDKRTPPLHEMHQIAWVIHARNRGPIGFSGDGKTEIVVEPPNPYGVPQQPATSNFALGNDGDAVTTKEAY